MAGNGRYIIQGQMTIIDQWNNKTIKSAQDLEDAQRILKIERIVPDRNSLVSFEIGNKTSQNKVLVFIDPFEDISKDVVKMAKAISLETDIVFQFSLSSFNREHMLRMTGRHCFLSNAKEDDAVDLFITEKNTDGIGCNNTRTLIEADLFKNLIPIMEMPFLVNQHGKVYFGIDVANKLKSIL
jgi:hypothetical protein